MKLLILLLLSNFISYSQLLNEEKIYLKNFNVYEKVGANLFGKVIKSGEANTAISINNIELKTYIALESTLLNMNEQVYIVSSTSKEDKAGKVIYNVDAYNGMDSKKKNFRFILEYVDKKLTKIYFPIPQGIFEFY